MARQFSDGTEGQPGAAPESTLAANIAAGATLLTVQAGHGARFPSTGTFSIRLEDAINADHFEIVDCSSRSTDTLTIGATTYAWDSGDKVIHVIAKADLDAFVETGDLAAYQALSEKGAANGYAGNNTANTFSVDQTLASLVNELFGAQGGIAADARLFISNNARYDASAANWLRRAADNDACRIHLTADGDLVFEVNSDAGTTVGSSITWTEKFRISKAGVMTLNGKVVSEGAADSGGAGYKVLRVPN